MNQRILVVIGTPLPQTLNHALAHAYIDEARSAGAELRVIDLARDAIPTHPTSRDELRAPRDQSDRTLDPAVEQYLGDVEWAEHIVFYYPQWWGTFPAAMKAFVDRVFLAGATFQQSPTTSTWKKLLTGRTARLVMTMDSPRWWNRLVYRNAAETSLKRAILGYCGIKTIGVTRFTPVRLSEESARAEWVERAASLGRRDGARPSRTPSNESVPG